MNFDNLGSPGKQSELTVPTSVATPIGRIIPSIKTLVIHDLDETFNTPNNRNTSNFFNSNIANIDSMDLDVGISPIMAKELQQLKQMISSVPGIVQLIPEASPTSHRISRFTPTIIDTEVPKCLQTPSMKIYDGTTEVEEHLAQYRERMEIIPIPSHLKEACMCKV